MADYHYCAANGDEDTGSTERRPNTKPCLLWDENEVNLNSFETCGLTISGGYRGELEWAREQLAEM